MSEPLSAAEKKAVHHCPTCTHLIASHDGSGCEPCAWVDNGTTIGTGPCAGISGRWFEVTTTYAAVAAVRDAAVERVLAEVETLVGQWPAGDNGQDYRAAVTQCSAAVRALVARLRDPS